MLQQESLRGEPKAYAGLLPPGMHWTQTPAQYRRTQQSSFRPQKSRSLQLSLHCLAKLQCPLQHVSPVEHVPSLGVFVQGGGGGGLASFVGAPSEDASPDEEDEDVEDDEAFEPEELDELFVGSEGEALDVPPLECLASPVSSKLAKLVQATGKATKPRAQAIERTQGGPIT